MSSLWLNPCSILRERASQQCVEDSRLSVLSGVIAIGDLLKSTLGPKGMDKMLVTGGKKISEGGLEVTNDGATILRSISVENPAAKIVIRASRAQDKEIGDGTTTLAVLVSELLQEAEKLHIHPQIIIQGWQEAVSVALGVLESVAIKNAGRNRLLDVARTALSSKILASKADFFAELAMKAYESSNKDLQSIHILKKLGGSLEDSFVDQGFLLDKVPGNAKKVKNAKIYLANIQMDTDRVKIYGARVTANCLSDLATIELQELRKMEAKVNAILRHGPNVFINRQLIYDYPQQLFKDAKVMTIAQADFEGVERLALATRAEIVSDVLGFNKVRLGTCDLVEVVQIGEDRLLRFSGLSHSKASCIVLRGSSEQLLNEAERSLHNALSTLAATAKDDRLVLGAGCIETIMAMAIEEKAAKTAGKISFAMESFARALMKIPCLVADNGGLDGPLLTSEIRKAHADGKITYGLDMNLKWVSDVEKMGIVEPYVLKRHILTTASETAEQLLRIDHMYISTPRTEEGKIIG